jgi:hypothetical protein
MRTVCVYSRRGCHLCERLIEELLPMLAGRGDLEVRDVDTNIDWRARFGERVPVVTVNGRIVCEARLDRHAVEKALSTA